MKTVEKTKRYKKDEFDLFLDTCETHFGEYYLFFLKAARTGVRIGELLAPHTHPAETEKPQPVKITTNSLW